MNDFGDYEEPVSRAFWGSEDFEDESTASPTFTLEWLDEPCSSIKTLIVVAGNIVTGVVEKCAIQDAQQICTVNSSVEFKVATLYRLSNDVCVFSVSTSVDLSSAGKFVEAISEVISRSDKVIALTNELMSRLNGMENESVSGPTMWRSLSTAKGTAAKLSLVPPLEHSNFIAGVAAGVIGYAQVLDIPGTAYILYTDEDAYDSETIAATVTLFAQVSKCAVIKPDAAAIVFNNNKLKLYI